MACSGSAHFVYKMNPTDILTAAQHDTRTARLNQAGANILANYYWVMVGCRVRIRARVRRVNRVGTNSCIVPNLIACKNTNTLKYKEKVAGYVWYRDNKFDTGGFWRIIVQ
ncbi:MAG: hypothetical protein ACC707_04215 [Thiohalomonadales bacterium]